MDYNRITKVWAWTQQGLASGRLYHFRGLPDYNSLFLLFVSLATTPFFSSSFCLWVFFKALVLYSFEPRCLVRRDDEDAQGSCNTDQKSDHNPCTDIMKQPSVGRIWVILVNTASKVHTDAKFTIHIQMYGLCSKDEREWLITDLDFQWNYTYSPLSQWQEQSEFFLLLKLWRHVFALKYETTCFIITW